MNNTAHIHNPAAVAVANAAARCVADKTLAPANKRLIIRQECQRAGVSIDEFIAAAMTSAANIRASLR